MNDPKVAFTARLLMADLDQTQRYLSQPELRAVADAGSPRPFRTAASAMHGPITETLPCSAITSPGVVVLWPNFRDASDRDTRASSRRHPDF